MNALRSIRSDLDLTQVQLAAVLGVTQGSVSFYEKGQVAIPSRVAARLIEFAASRGRALTYDAIYAGAPAEPASTQKAEA